MEGPTAKQQSYHVLAVYELISDVQNNYFPELPICDLHQQFVLEGQQ